MNTNKNAFTMAEILISLLIVGVVAVLTLQVLLSNMQRMQTETKLKNTYAIIQQAIRHSLADGMMVDEIIADNSVNALKNWAIVYIDPYLKISQKCYGTTGCWHKSNITKDLNGAAPHWNSSAGPGLDVVVYILQNGSFVSLDGYGLSSAVQWYGISKKFQNMIIYFDVNGYQKPNRIGKDIYILGLANNGLVPAGQDKSDVDVKNNCLTGNGYWCLKYVMNSNWKIDPKVWSR